MKRKILIIEDEPFVILMMRMRLENSQFEVITASDGLEGIHKLETENPDVIILDVLIPKLDGFHFVKKLRSRKDDKRLVPVIVMSARESSRDLFDKKDISAFYTKPFDSLELLDKVKEVLKISEEVRGTQRKALLVGFDWDALRPIKAVLEAHDFAVHRSRDAHEAVQDAVKLAPDVIFAPSLLAGMDIWEFCILLKDLPITKNVPFVVYDLGNVGAGGTTTIKATKIIDYKSHEDLQVQTEKFLKEYF